MSYINRLVGKYPLRKIVRSSTNHGVVIEHLECGHDQMQRHDIKGPTNADARRCKTCYVTTRQKKQIEAFAATQPPYPWCLGNPTKEDCIKLGYCTRKPSCGE